MNLGALDHPAWSLTRLQIAQVAQGFGDALKELLAVRFIISPQKRDGTWDSSAAYEQTVTVNMIYETNYEFYLAWLWS